MGITTLATLAACATAWFGPAALARQPNCPTGTMQVQPPPDFPHLQQYWPTMTLVGSGTCTVSGIKSVNFPGYRGMESHKWEIIRWKVWIR